MLNIHSFQPVPLCGDCNLYVWLCTPSLGLPLVVVIFNFRYIKGGSKTGVGDYIVMRSEFCFMKGSGYCELGLEGYVFVFVCLYMCVFVYLHTCGGCT